MIDLQLIEGFEWDSGNDRKSAEKHDVSRSEAEQIFFNEPLLLLPDPGHGQTERRFHALGITESRRLLHVSFTLRAAGKLISSNNVCGSCLKSWQKKESVSIQST